MTQDELKTLVGQAALQYVVPGEIVGVGTGSTVNKFIEALASMKDQIKGAVSSSEASTARLKALGIAVFDSNEVDSLSVYIDGADEIDPHGHMIKGGGAALTAAFANVGAFALGAAATLLPAVITVAPVNVLPIGEVSRSSPAPSFTSPPLAGFVRFPVP